jgi:hypothetical protein
MQFHESHATSWSNADGPDRHPSQKISAAFAAALNNAVAIVKLVGQNGALRG